MATPFLVPLHLQDLELPKADRVCVRHVQSFDGASLDDVAQLLRALSGRVLRETSRVNDGDDGGRDDDDAEPALLETDNFDLCYSLVKKLASLSEAAQVRVLLTFTTIVSHLTKTIRASASRAQDDRAVEDLRSEFKAAVYFLVMAIAALCRLRAQADQAVIKQKNSSSSSSCKTPWGKHIESALHALNRSICDETFGLWRMNLPEEEFANLYCRAAIHVMENSALTRSKTMKAEIYKSIGSTILRVPSVRLPFVASIVDLIFNHEHLTNTLAELTEQLPTVYEYSTFPGDLIREISTISSGDPSKDVNGTRNISNFLTTLATKSPALIISNLTFVLGLLESESYQLRNSGVACIASILLWSYRQQGKGADDDPDSDDDDDEDKDAEDSGADEDETTGDENEVLNDDDDDATSSGAAAMAAAARKKNRDRDRPSLHTLSRTTRDQLLSVLEDRVHDVNSFARSHVLKMWNVLCESGAVPLATIKRVIALAIGRLQDKAAVVRRHSIALLTLLLHNNPFMGKLDRQFHLKKQAEIRAAMVAKREGLLAQAQHEMDTIEDGDAAMDQALATKDDEMEDAHVQQEFTAMQRVIAFHAEALEFIDAFETSALKLMVQLLGSKSTSDALEAMSFIRQAHTLQLSGANDAFKKLLPLIWKSDPAVRDEVLNVFVSLFLRPESRTGSQNFTAPEELATNLLQLLDECSVAEFTCIEKIIRELQHSNQMPVAVVSALWEFVDSDHFPAPVITNALLLLGMVASADDRALLAGGRLQQVLVHGFGRVACSQDATFRLFGAASRLIQHVKFDSLTKTKRLQRVPTDDLSEIIGQIQRVLALEDAPSAASQHADSVSATSKHLASSTWFDAVQQAIDAVFAVCERPEEVSADVIKCLASRIFTDGNDSVVDSLELAHFLFVLGHVAIQSAIRVEQMAGQIKRLRANQDKSGPPSGGSGSNAQSNNDANDVAAMEDELGVAAEVEAEEDSFVQDLIRQDLVCRHLLGLYGPLVVRLLHAACTGESYDAHVIECAVVALSKFMAVSDAFCEKNLQLLFTLLQESSVPTVRANIVVALGDLAFRFPNLIEPWTAHLYNRLRDVDDSVRKNTTVVLSHLILNDMVKVKGQISEIAISLVDSNSEIRNLVQLFFTELSKKGNNPIYNIFPDTVGQLSTSELVSTKEFDQIIKFLLNFLTKDKHIESIVEKICQRYSAALAKQRRDFSFCLAHAQHTEKSLRYMNQSRKLFKESLADSNVQDHFKLLITRARRHHNAGTSSAELKEIVDQLEQFFLDDTQAEENEEETTSDLGMPPTPGKAPRTPSKPKKSRPSSAATATQKTPTAAPVPRRPTRKTRKQKQKPPRNHNDDENDDEDEDEDDQ